MILRARQYARVCDIILLAWPVLLLTRPAQGIDETSCGEFDEFSTLQINLALRRPESEGREFRDLADRLSAQLADTSSYPIAEEIPSAQIDDSLAEEVSQLAGRSSYPTLPVEIPSADIDDGLTPQVEIVNPELALMQTDHEVTQLADRSSYPATQEIQSAEIGDSLAEEVTQLADRNSYPAAEEIPELALMQTDQILRQHRSGLGLMQTAGLGNTAGLGDGVEVTERDTAQDYQALLAKNEAELVNPYMPQLDGIRPLGYASTAKDMQAALDRTQKSRDADLLRSLSHIGVDMQTWQKVDPSFQALPRQQPSAAMPTDLLRNLQGIGTDTQTWQKVIPSFQALPRQQQTGEMPITSNRAVPPLALEQLDALLQAEKALAPAINTPQFDASTNVLDGKPRICDKVVLMALELLPPLGMLGIPRMYMGCWITGMLQCISCCLSCGIVGFVWALVDMILLVINAADRSNSIDVFFMQCTFTSGSSIDSARTLGWMALVSWSLWSCCLCLAYGSFIRHYYFEAP